MQVENSLAYTSPLYTRAAHPAENKDGKQASTPTPSQSGETNTANTAKTAAVTGTTNNNLSSEVMSQLIATAQETNTANANLDNYDGPLSIGERHHLEDIANDPAYAASQAKSVGVSGELVAVGKVLPTLNNGFSDAQREAFLTKSRAQVAEMEVVQRQRTAYYESLTAQDLPPAEIFAKLLEFNANLPESHDATLGWTASGRVQSYSDYNQTRLDYLRQAITQAKPLDVIG